MQRFAEDYVSHLNPFTGLRYKDDPAIIALLLTNENDLTHHFGNALLPDKKVPLHNAIYMAEAAAFAAKHDLPKDKTWRSWEHGPSKIFLNDLEHRFNVSQIGHLRGLGARALIATTSSFGGNPLSSLPALTAGDVIAVHSYGGVGELEKSPLHAANLMHWIAAAQIVGRPLVVPEWNVERFPVPDRHAIPLYLAAAASLQGWDAMMQYAYSQQALSSRGSPSNWHAFNDPALIATLPAAALLYRRGHVQEARTTYVFAPGREQLFNRAISPANSVALRTAAEKGRLVIAMPRTPELPWLEESPLPSGRQGDHRSGTFADRAAMPPRPCRTRASCGATGSRASTASTRRARRRPWAGSAASRSSSPMSRSRPRRATPPWRCRASTISRSGATRAILISLGARSVPKAGNQVPFHSEPVTGRLSIRAAPGLKLYRQHGLPRDAREIPARYADGRYHIDARPEPRQLLARVEISAGAAHRHARHRPSHAGPHPPQAPRARRQRLEPGGLRREPGHPLRQQPHHDAPAGAGDVRRHGDCHHRHGGARHVLRPRAQAEHRAEPARRRPGVPQHGVGAADPARAPAVGDRARHRARSSISPTAPAWCPRAASMPTRACPG